VSRLKKIWRSLGPGLIVGAADNDPSGITVYSLAGAKFGLTALWTALATLPFMIFTQRMAGRIGLISGKGLVGNMKKYYPRWILLLIALLILVANIINIGADISAMAAASEVLLPGISPIFLSVLISGFITLLLIVSSYRSMVKYLKWVAMIMLSYVLAAFFVQQNWLEIFTRLIIPKFIMTKDYLMMVLAVFGTTISPYLFFWQASETVEEEKTYNEENPRSAVAIPATDPHITHHDERIIKNEIGSIYKDVRYGMIFSNTITFFIIILCSSTLFQGGLAHITTMKEIASALEPLAGHYSNLLFLIGLLASGALAIPVLAGSAAYIISELFNWRWGFSNPFHKAKEFYSVLIIATLLGIAIPVFELHPVQILFYTGVIYGVISPALILILIHMANNPKIMGKFTNRTLSNVVAYLLFLIMTASSILVAVL
jgi:NRAMP (natural resistance-associated macrophage protein)-like metal ion transporter